MFKFIFLWLFFLVSFAFPPLLLVSGSLLVLAVVRWTKTRSYQRRVMQRGLEVHTMMAIGKVFSK